MKDKKPTYDELVFALKETHNLHTKAIKGDWGTHNLTNINTNQLIFERIEENNKNK